jgi:hypothetical protein
MGVQALGPELAIETLDVAIVGRLARCQSAPNIGSDAFLMTISFTLRRSNVPEEDPAWHAHTFAF